MEYAHKMKCFSVTKRNEILTYAIYSRLVLKNVLYEMSYIEDKH